MEGRLRSSRRDRCVANGRGPGVGWAGRERPLSEGVSSLGNGGAEEGIYSLPPSLPAFPSGFVWLIHSLRKHHLVMEQIIKIR